MKVEVDVGITTGIASCLISTGSALYYGHVGQQPELEFMRDYGVMVSKGFLLIGCKLMQEGVRETFPNSYPLAHYFASARELLQKGVETARIFEKQFKQKQTVSEEA